MSTTNTQLHQNTGETVSVTEYAEKEKQDINNTRTNVSHVSIYPHQYWYLKYASMSKDGPGLEAEGEESCLSMDINKANLRQRAWCLK